MSCPGSSTLVYAEFSPLSQFNSIILLCLCSMIDAAVQEELELKHINYGLTRTTEHGPQLAVLVTVKNQHVQGVVGGLNHHQN